TSSSPNRTLIILLPQIILLHTLYSSLTSKEHMQGGVVASTFLPVWPTTAACCSPRQSYTHTETGRNNTVKLEGRLRPMREDYMTKDVIGKFSM
ncbi:192_t:CDS:2, partial [Paraglomus occultum]